MSRPKESPATSPKEEERTQLHKAIWGIADALRGSVSGWEFKAYVLGTLFYRFISEKLETSQNLNEAKAGNAGFVYGDLKDSDAQAAKRQIVEELGYFISPSHLFRNVHKGAATNRNLNVTLSDVFAEIEDSTPTARRSGTGRASSRARRSPPRATTSPSRPTSSRRTRASRWTSGNSTRRSPRSCGARRSCARRSSRRSGSWGNETQLKARKPMSKIAA